MNKYAMTPQGQYHGPLPVRDFFPLPNVIFDLGLTAEEIAIYAFLMKCEDRRTYTCYPSYKTIGNAIGKSRNTVIKYVNMLEEKCLITKHKTFVITKDGKAWNGNLIFKIAPLRSRLKSGVRHDAVHQTAEPTVAMFKAFFGVFVGCCISGSIF